jgi:hypothetical protein
MAYSYQSGVNLGGWISQYRQPTKEHFETFIVAQDIERIATWGMDHVRLPVDYPVIEDDDRPGEYKEEGLEYIDRCLTWCQSYDLGLILDLHRAPGYSFGHLDSNSLFDSKEDQDRYIQLWQNLARRYHGTDDGLQLELLNEVVEPNSDRWNRLAHQTIAAIRAIDPTRSIIYGGNHYNSIDHLSAIDWLPDDDHIVYTFHFYKPHLFTHQNAPWSEITREYAKTIHYPGGFPDLDQFVADHPGLPDVKLLQQDHPEHADRDLLRQLLEPATAFVEATGKPVYCGEYGVIEHAPLASRIAWHRDFVGLLRDLSIGRAVWSYKAMSFGLVDASGHVLSEELISIVSQS